MNLRPNYGRLILLTAHRRSIIQLLLTSHGILTVDVHMYHDNEDVSALILVTVYYIPM